ncbi:RNA polymerase sigma factor [Bowmanella dokdonensis]|uniref:RNA polymerase sigma factor n=1 Tax=Bowmanella dokdonensis TaxID=751969 RepID=A0A939IMH3_9ALTE|nr:RNA polymerase sigma factor [Bowmanella dokdonensis]MBN7825313.1 RNA polymerase sigma factor [Bowmanella dokdonensis]
MKHFSDEQLVAIAQGAQELGAFDELFKRSDGRLRAFLRSRVNENLVDDVVQETYISAFTRIGNFQGGASFSTWLFSIAINEYKQLLRKASSFERLRGLLFRQPPRLAAPHLNDVFIDFSRLAAALSDKQYDVYVLHTVYGYSHAEVAARLDFPLGSVKTCLSQAEKLMRRQAND